jgi:hypothetical protein
MRYLNFLMKPSFNCGEDDLNDSAFIWASKHIRGWEAVEEFIACDVWSLASGVSFKWVKVGLTPVSKLKVPLPRFAVVREDDEDNVKFLARVEKSARVKQSMKPALP